MNQQPPTLRTSVTQSEAALVISWSFVNNAQEALYVCTRTNLDNKPCGTPYIYLSQSDAALTVAFRKMPLPKDRNIYEPILPFYRLLEPGESIHETCTVALPVHEHHAYADPECSEKTIPVQVAKLAFLVEYFWLKDKHFAVPAPDETLLARAGGGRHLILENVNKLSRSVTVLKRTEGSFVRPGS